MDSGANAASDYNLSEVAMSQEVPKVTFEWKRSVLAWMEVKRIKRSTIADHLKVSRGMITQLFDTTKRSHLVTGINLMMQENPLEETEHDEARGKEFAALLDAQRCAADRLSAAWQREYEARVARERAQREQSDASDAITAFNAGLK